MIKPGISMGIYECMQEVRAFASEHLTECASEIIELREKGVLPNGRVKELAGILRPVDKHRSLHLAEETVAQLCIDVVANQTPT